MLEETGFTRRLGVESEGVVTDGGEDGGAGLGNRFHEADPKV